MTTQNFEAGADVTLCRLLQTLLVAGVCAAALLATPAGAAPAPQTGAQAASGAADHTGDEEAESEAEEEATPAKRRGLRLPSMGRAWKPPAERMIADGTVFHLQDVSAFERIELELGKPNACDTGSDAFDTLEALGERSIDRRIIEALLTPLGVDHRQIKFRWYSSPIVNCRTNLREANSFECSTGLLEAKVQEGDQEPRNLTSREIAFVMAHELAHLLKGHDKGAAQAAKRAELVQTLAGVAIIAGALAEANWTKKADGTYDPQMGNDSLKAIWAAAAFGDAVKNSSCDLTGADYARDQETEADLYAIDMMMKADWSRLDAELGEDAVAVDPARLRDLLASLKGQSDIKFQKTSEALQLGLREFASRELLEALTGSALSSQGLGASDTNFWMGVGLRVGLNLYADYRNRQGLAFHPDPTRRFQRIETYLNQHWAEALAAEDAGALAALSRLKGAAGSEAGAAETTAPPVQQASASQMDPWASVDQRLSREIDRLREDTKRRIVAPDELVTALAELERTELRRPAPAPNTATPEEKARVAQAITDHQEDLTASKAYVEELKASITPGSTAAGDYALALYHQYKDDGKNALKFAVSATKLARPTPTMFSYAANLQMVNKQTANALETLAAGAQRFGEADFYAATIRAHELMGNAAAAEEVRGRCLADTAASAQVRALCAPQAEQTQEAAATAEPSTSVPAALENPMNALRGLLGGGAKKE